VTLYDLSRYRNCPIGFALVVLSADDPFDAGTGTLWLLAEDLVSVSEPLWYKMLLEETPPDP
jgi:hypothetical protein